MSELSYIEREILRVFKEKDEIQNKILPEDFPVRLHTYRLKNKLGQFSNAQIRAACRSLVSKGMLREDPNYSAVNSLCWRYK